MEEETILALDDRELYRLFMAKRAEILDLRDEEGQRRFFKEDIDKVKNGIGIPFSFALYLAYKDHPHIKIFREQPKKNLMSIRQHNIQVPFLDFQDELEDRRSIIVNALLTLYCEDNEIFTSG